MLRTLTASDFDTVHGTFLEAFSDYVVKLSPTRQQLLEMFTRRGWVPELSVGVFDGDRLVAFTLNGRTGSDAYDTGTGVAPSHRRCGLAQEMMAFSCERLREAGCSRYVLEVIESNTPAIQLYLADGFVETRRLQCWSYDAQRAVSLGEVSGERVEWWDVQPSWQNSPASLARARDRFVTIGDDESYAIVFPSTGDLPRLAVQRDARRHGRGTQLLDAAATLAGKPLRIMNVDARDAGIEAFLERAGANRTVRQIEMAKALR